MTAPLLGPWLGAERPILEIEGGIATGIVLMICAGLVVGALARIVAPSRDPGGVAATLTVAVAGALAAGMFGRGVGWYGAGDGVSVVVIGIVAAIGAATLLWMYRAISERVAVRLQGTR